jgi:uncharacterized protein (TIGR02118 family)
MAKLYALYRQPTDATAFDRYYVDRHIPLAKKLPGLRSYEVTRGPIAALGGPTPYHLIAALSFDSRAAIDAALASPEGKAAAGDLGNFASGGVDLLIADTDLV